MTKLFILGHTGNVGSELIKQVYKLDQSTIVGLANSSGYILKLDGIVDGITLCERETFKTRATAYKSLSALTAILIKKLPKETIIVDVTADASQDMCDLHTNLIKKSFHIATANKNPLSLFSYDTFKALTASRGHYGYNATVMAGGDATSYVQDMMAIGDPLKSIQGCFSGTLGYIMSGLEEGKQFSKIVADAHLKKYTEPHPWDDLNGLDIARKLLILARSAGIDATIDDVIVEPLLPARFGEIRDVEKFLAAIREADSEMKQRSDEAKKKQMTLRFVASLKKNDKHCALRVQMEEVPLKSTIGQLKGTANIIQIITRDRAPEDCPHSIITKGAGTIRTAAAVRADIARMATAA
ncbi:MAG: hypothetical protein KBD00_05985 [Candidatus Peribacteraceae bacterium]|nr:hypothetical protein [Candidatus Peribacteraceae bacterium]